MKHDLNWKAQKDKEITISYNMGLEMAVFVLEMAEGLSKEERKHLIDLLKKNIAEGESRYPIQELEQFNTKVLENA